MKKLTKTWQELRRNPRIKVLIVSGNFLLVIVMGWAVVSISPRADTLTTVSFQAESGTKTGTITTVLDSGAAGGSAVKFGEGSTANPGCAPLSYIPAGFPNNCTTGYKAAPDYPGSLTPFTGTIQSNTTYYFRDFNGGADVGRSGNPVSNVKFYGCRFRGTAVEDKLVGIWGDNITFEYSTFEPDTPFVPNAQVAYNKSYQYGISTDGSWGTYVQQLTVLNSDFWGFGNAIDIAGSTQAKPQVFRGNWIHDAAQDGGSYHTDGIGTLSGSGTGSYMVLDNNTIESPGNTNGIAFQQGSYSNVTITNNLIGGWGYAVAIWAPAPNTTFTGNVFSTRLRPGYGPLYPQGFWTSSGSVWKNNRWKVPPGAAYGNAADDGKFWTPNGPSNTDYQ